MAHIGPRVKELFDQGLSDQQIIDSFEIWREKSFAQMELRGLKNKLARSKEPSSGSPGDTTATITGDKNE